eukprot:m.754624 g.754624  ORF g.754624 m.754624 type:complete len:175 (+) comp23175_c1_seq3:565-1089(+)
MWVYVVCVLLYVSWCVGCVACCMGTTAFCWCALLVYRPLGSVGTTLMAVVYLQEGRSATANDNSPCPRAFIDPISLAMMNDPVVTADGQSYERASIVHWFDLQEQRAELASFTSPLTGAAVVSRDVLPNVALRNAIDDWLTQQRAYSAPGTPMSDAAVDVCGDVSMHRASTNPP